MDDGLKSKPAKILLEIEWHVILRLGGHYENWVEREWW
jgi:hypothetical protein